MYRGSIFERLTGTLQSGRATTSEEALYQSIANNLSRIFSTNAGSAQTVEDYGRPDLNNIEMSMKDSIESIEMRSQQCIRKYEPRLFKTRVAVSTEHLEENQMNVHIEGYLRINGQSKRIRYKADLLSNGRVKVYRNDD